jgi:uncharacterized repeat protein (TIGR03803 family)
MSLNRNSGVFSVSVLVVILGILMVAPVAWGQSKFKTLYTFMGGADGSGITAGLVFDQMGNLYGTTAGGGDLSDCGASGCGTVFKLTPNGDGTWTKSVLHFFNGGDGLAPVGGLIFDQAGNLYGTTVQGGSGRGQICRHGFAGCGTVFQLTPNKDGSWTESVLHSFSGGDGLAPQGSLIFDPNGNLYGTTGSGGDLKNCDSGCGTVFKLTPNGDGTWTESRIRTFHGGADGSLPGEELIFDKGGNLYGMTELGGAGDGTVFQLAPTQNGNWKKRVLHNFHGYDGADPLAGVISDAAGNLYGTTVGGGLYTYGTVFKLKHTSTGLWIIDVIHSFNGIDGLSPFAGLIFDPAGNLYGSTYFGANDDFGTIFRLKPAVHGGWNETVLHSFRNLPGAYPYSSLTLDGSGDLYGTTIGDGTKTFGSVFVVTP